MRVKVHPLFFVLALALVALGQALAFLWTFCALVLHELGHAAMARARGFTVNQLVLFPFGAMMSVNERFDKTSGLLIGLAGPAVNVVLALITLGLWWVQPAAYPYTEHFLYANVSLAAFNLLPVYPLDGSRAVLALAKNRLKAVKGMQIAGIALSIAGFALFIASAFIKINFSLGIISVFLFYAAAFGTKEEVYVSVLDTTSKNYLLGVECKTVRVSRYTPIVRLYHHVKATSETVFVITDENGTELTRMDEAGLKALALRNRLSEYVGRAAGVEGKYGKLGNAVKRDNFAGFKRKIKAAKNKKARGSGYGAKAR
jgi:stage IV sporulation protein FB